MRQTIFKPAISVHRIADGYEDVQYLGWETIEMVVGTNLALLRILAGAILYGIEGPYTALCRLYLICCYLLLVGGYFLLDDMGFFKALFVILIGASTQLSISLMVWYGRYSY